MPYTYGKSVASTLLKFKGNIQSLWMVWRNQNVIESDSEAKKCTCPHPKNEIKQVSTHKMRTGFHRVNIVSMKLASLRAEQSKMITRTGGLCS